MLGRFIKQSWLVLVAALVFGLLVAIVDGALREKIALNAWLKLEGEMKTLLGQDNTYEAVKDEADGKTLYYVGTDSEGNIVGYAFEAKGSGFADKIELVIAVDKNCEKFFGFKVLDSKETPGFGDKIKTEDFYRNQFIGAPCKEFTLSKMGDDKKIDSEIVAITGATVTSEAVVKILNNFISQVKARMKEKGFM